MGCLPRRKAGRIPAHAGKTLSTPRSGIHRRAHPRSRGENAQMNCAQSIWYGASPLTRGKRGLRRPGPARAGRIPAHAGKTHPPPGCPRRARAHPRSRGENGGPGRITGPRPGASPLTRGKPEREQAETSSARRIPAHAGKTMQWWCQYGDLGAHPRSRGENRSAPNRAESRGGASPLTRGKPQGITTRAAPFGRIPAHAGKTKEGKVAVLALGAHPRSRGENTAADGRINEPTGASPLTRGKQWITHMVSAMVRRIPAHAGKTGEHAVGSFRGGAHPRSRGENVLVLSQLLSAWGASPLTRGKHDFELRVRLLVGRIPAHAGKT